MTQKAVVFDASTIISIAMNGLLEDLRELKQAFSGKFIVTQEVKHEIVDKPIKIKRFELEALQINKLIKDKILEFPQSLEVDETQISPQTKEIIEIANTTFQKNKENIPLIHSGEASCLVLGKMLTQKKIKHVLAIDERTTRMLCEKPDNLQKLLAKKHHTKITYKKENIKHFHGCNIIRSTELIYIAFKKGFIALQDPRTLDALLYALKYKGCSISQDEIEEIKRIR